MNKRPKMLVMRGPREACLAFYSKFRKFKITYFAGENPSYKSTVKGFPQDFKIITRPFFPKFWGNINNLSLAAISGLDALVKDSDIVNISDTYYSFNSQTVGLAKKYEKMVITMVWTTIPSHISSWLPPYSLFTKNVIAKTDLFILRNKTAYKFTDSIGIDRRRTVMIYKGVDLSHFYPKENTNSNKLKILYVGIYHESKGIKDLVNAIEKIHKEGYRIELHLAGRGALENYINKKSETLPIVNHGFVTYENLGDLYRTADIFCSPSKEIKFLGIKVWEEYFSYTLMEAQASGLPIVTTNSGGIPEEVDSRNFLIGIGDIDSLCNSLKKLILDDELRKKLSVINRTRAEKLFDSETQAKKTEEAIIQILKTDKH